MFSYAMVACLSQTEAVLSDFESIEMLSRQGEGSIEAVCEVGARRIAKLNEGTDGKGSRREDVSAISRWPLAR